MTLEVCQTQVARRFMSKDFELPLVPGSSFLLHLGPGLSDTPAKSCLTFPLCPQMVQMAVIKHYTGDLLRGAVHPHIAEGHVYCLIHSKGSRRANQPQVSAAAISVVPVTYPVTDGRTKWVVRAIGQKKIAPVCPVSLLWPSSRCVCNPPTIRCSDTPGASQGLAMISGPIGCLPWGGWAEPQLNEKFQLTLPDVHYSRHVH